MKYFLVPCMDKEEVKQYKMDWAPKYLDEFGIATDLIAKTVEQKESTITKLLQNYYVIVVDDAKSEQVLSSKPDVLELNATTQKSEMDVLGIDTSKIIGDGYEERDKAVTKWLIEEEKVLSTILQPPKKTIEIQKDCL